MNCPKLFFQSYYSALFQACPIDALHLSSINNATLIPNSEDARVWGWLGISIGKLGLPAEALVHICPAGNLLEAEFIPEFGAVIKLVMYDI